MDYVVIGMSKWGIGPALGSRFTLPHKTGSETDVNEMGEAGDAAIDGDASSDSDASSMGSISAVFSVKGSYDLIQIFRVKHSSRFSDTSNARALYGGRTLSRASANGPQV